MTLNRHLLFRILPLVVFPTIILSVAGFIVSHLFVTDIDRTESKVRELSEDTLESAAQLVEAFSEMQTRQHEFTLQNAVQLIDQQIEQLEDLLLTHSQKNQLAIFCRGDPSMRAHLEPALRTEFETLVQQYAFAEISLLDEQGDELLRVADYIVPAGANPVSGGQLWKRENPSTPDSLIVNSNARTLRELITRSIAWKQEGIKHSRDEVLTMTIPLLFSGINPSISEGKALGYLRAEIPLEPVLQRIPQKSLEDGVFALKPTESPSDTTRTSKPDSLQPKQSNPAVVIGHQTLEMGVADLVLMVDPTRIDASIQRVKTAQDAYSSGVNRIFGLVDDFNQTILQSLWMIAGGVTILILVTVLIVFTAARAIARPIIKLTKDASQIRDGDYISLVHAQSPVSELVDLGKSLNEMRGRLLIEITARDHLVRDRTTELEIANERLRTEVLERRRAEEKANAGSEAKSAFVATISHEIRTPLNGIIGSIDLFRASANLDKEERSLLETAESSAELLLGVVNDVLDFSKIEAGALKLSIEKFESHAIMVDMERLFAPQLAAKGVEYINTLEPSAQCAFYGDSFRIKQILVNLLGNAMKFTTSGFVSLKIWHEQAPSDDPGSLHLVIADTGPGIPHDRIDELFQPFEQLDTSFTRQAGGTGLGLSICHRLIALMEGTIKVTSEVGKGSTFHIMLPLKKVDSCDEDSPEEKAPTNKLDTSLRILVVEDNLVNQRIMKRMLIHQGHRPSLASNGREALEILSTEPFDLVFMDYQMPIMDGITTTRIIRSWPDNANNAQVPIIALTANNSSDDRAMAIDVGMDEFLSKPIRMQTLAEVIERMHLGSPPSVIELRS